MKDYSLKFFSREIRLSQKEELFINAYMNEPLGNRNLKLEALGLLTYLQMQLFTDGETGFYFNVAGARKELLAYKVGITNAELDNILNWCFTYEILDKEMYDKYSILTSRKMQDDYSKVLEKRAQNINMEYVYKDDYAGRYEGALLKYKLSLLKKEMLQHNKEILATGDTTEVPNLKIAPPGSTEGEQNSTDKIRQDKIRLDEIREDEKRLDDIKAKTEKEYIDNQISIEQKKEGDMSPSSPSLSSTNISSSSPPITLNSYSLPSSPMLSSSISSSTSPQSTFTIDNFKAMFPSKYTSKQLIVPSNVNLELLAKKINEQPWLLNKNHLDWAWCLAHYIEIINNKYADFSSTNNANQENTYGPRKYTKEFFDSLYTDLSTVEL